MSMYFSSFIHFPMGRDRLFFDSFCFVLFWHRDSVAENVFLASDSDHDVSLNQAARKRYPGFIKVRRVERNNTRQQQQHIHTHKKRKTQTAETSRDSPGHNPHESNVYSRFSFQLPSSSSSSSLLSFPIIQIYLKATLFLSFIISVFLSFLS